MSMADVVAYLCLVIGVHHRRRTLERGVLSDSSQPICHVSIRTLGELVVGSVHVGVRPVGGRCHLRHGLRLVESRPNAPSQSPGTGHRLAMNRSALWMLISFWCL